MDLLDIDISKIGMSSSKKKRVLIQIMNLIIYHSKLVRWDIKNKSKINPQAWASDELVNIIKRYTTLIGYDLPNFNINAFDIFKRHKKDVIGYFSSSKSGINSNIGDCDITTETKLVVIINEFLEQNGVSKSNLI